MQFGRQYQTFNSLIILTLQLDYRKASAFALLLGDSNASPLRCRLELIGL